MKIIKFHVNLELWSGDPERPSTQFGRLDFSDKKKKKSGNSLKFFYYIQGPTQLKSIVELLKTTPY